MAAKNLPTVSADTSEPPVVPSVEASSAPTIEFPASKVAIADDLD